MIIPYSLKTCIHTNQLANSVQFYCQHFGMAILEQWHSGDDQGAILTLNTQQPNHLLELLHCDKPPPPLGVSLQFEVSDVHLFKQQCPLPSNGPIQKPWGSQYLYLSDPNGVPIIVYEKKK